MPPEDIDMEYQDQMNEEERELEEQMKDWVRVVRCKDCKHWINHDKRCGLLNHGMKITDYCSYGKRKETK